jgi:hypothetical protein
MPQFLRLQLEFRVPVFIPPRNRAEEQEEDEVNLRPMVSRPVCPGVALPSVALHHFLSDDFEFLDVGNPL